MELNEKTLMTVLKGQADNMRKTLNQAKEGSNEMLPVWYLVVYYEAEQIKKAIEIYMKQKIEHGRDMCEAFHIAQLEAIEKQCKEKE